MSRESPPAAPLWIISDYQRATIGVMLLTAQIRDLAPLIEKQLRDSGQIDGFSKVLIHQQQQIRNAYRVFFTVVPLPIWTAWQQWVSDSREYIVTTPLAAAMLHWAQGNGHHDSLLLLLQPKDMVILQLVEGQVQVAERSPLLQDSPPEVIVERVLRQLRQTTAGAAPPLPSRLLLLRHGQLAETLLPQLLQRLGQQLGGIDGEIVATTHCGEEERGACSSLPQLFPQQRLAAADLAPALRLQLFAAALLRWLPAAMLIAAALLLWQAEQWQRQAAVLQTQADALRAELPDRDPQQALRVALEESTELTHLADEVAGLQHLLVQQRHLPQLPQLISDIRSSLPANFEVIEIGVVAERETAVITLLGISESFVPTMEREGYLVNNLEKRGYQMVLQTIETSPSGQSTFDLAMTWRADATRLAESLNPASAPPVQHPEEKHNNLFGSVGDEGKVREVGLNIGNREGN